MRNQMLIRVSRPAEGPAWKLDLEISEEDLEGVVGGLSRMVSPSGAATGAGTEPDRVNVSTSF